MLLVLTAWGGGAGMMVMSYVFVLSFFPHQEARFLLPVLMPMSLLFGHRMAADGSWMMRCPQHRLSSKKMALIASNYDIVCSLRIKWPLSPRVAVRLTAPHRAAASPPNPSALLPGWTRHSPSVRRLRCGWLVHNVVMLVGFGGLHQAGVTRAVSDLGFAAPAVAPAPLAAYATATPPIFLPPAVHSSRRGAHGRV